MSKDYEKCQRCKKKDSCAKAFTDEALLCTDPAGLAKKEIGFHRPYRRHPHPRGSELSTNDY